jgi:hypothetical protein
LSEYSIPRYPVGLNSSEVKEYASSAKTTVKQKCGGVGDGGDRRRPHLVFL